MASTKNGIVYPDNYDKVADVPADMKKMAESIDENIEANAENIETNQNDIKALQVENAEVKAENERLRSDIKSISLVGEAEGASIDLDDCSDARFLGFGLGGNHKQETRSGKNLYNLKDVSFSSDGITVDEDDWITFTCDNSSGKDIYLNYYTNNLDLKTDTNYAIILEVKQSTGTGRLNVTSVYNSEGQFDSVSYFDIKNLKKSKYKIVKKTLSDFSSTTQGLRTYARYAQGEAGTITVRISVLEDTSVDLDIFVYEKYGASPSPDFPSEVETVKDGIEVKVANNDNTEIQTITMPVQQEMLQGDYFDWDNEKEVHNWKKIASYNGETISTDYISTTGQLSTGATIYYKLENSTELDFTDEQNAVAKQIKETLHTYKNVTYIYSDDEVSPIMNVEYAKDPNAQNSNLQEQIDEIKQLISTTQTSAMLLENLQKEVESEVE